jgi:hypothetical protein
MASSASPKTRTSQVNPKVTFIGQINRVQAPSAAASNNPILHLIRSLFLSHLPERVIKLGARNEGIAAIGYNKTAGKMYY